MKINEGTLSKLISEAINEELKNIDNLSELFHSDADFKTHEKKDSDEKKDDMADDKKKTIEGEVSDFFDDNGVNTAQYAYKLYGVKPKKGKDSKDEKNARGLFMKKLHHEKDKRTGYTYSFDSKELNKLESMISDRLNEAKLSKIISESIQKVISDEDYGKMDKEKGKVIVHNGQTIYIWKEPNGDYAASSQNPKENYIDANRTVRFPKANGFLNINDVEDYIKRYFN